MVSCEKPKNLIVIGDSTARQVFWGLARVNGVNTDNPRYNHMKADKHKDMEIKLPSCSGVVKFFWDPYFNSTGQKYFIEHKTEGRELVYISVGLWFSRNYAVENDELATVFGKALYRIENGLKYHENVYLSPVLYPNWDLMNEDRKSTILEPELHLLNRLLIFMFQPFEAESIIMRFNGLAENDEYDKSGIHFVDYVCDEQARRLLRRASIPFGECSGGFGDILSGWVGFSIIMSLALWASDSTRKWYYGLSWWAILNYIGYGEGGILKGSRLASTFGLFGYFAFVVWQNSQRHGQPLTADIELIEPSVHSSDENFSTNRNAERWVRNRIGNLACTGLILSVYFRSKKFGILFGNVSISLFIIAMTDHVLNYQAPAEEQEDAQVKYSSHTKLIKSLVKDFLPLWILALSETMTTARIDSHLFLFVFNDPSRCLLLLLLYGLTCLMLRLILNSISPAFYSTSISSSKAMSSAKLTGLLLLSKAFLFVITKLWLPQTFDYSGFELLDLISFKFGLTYRKTSFLVLTRLAKTGVALAGLVALATRFGYLELPGELTGEVGDVVKGFAIVLGICTALKYGENSRERVLTGATGQIGSGREVPGRPLGDWDWRETFIYAAVYSFIF